MFYIDGHCDTLSKALDEKKDLNDDDLQFSFSKAQKNGGGIQIMASFIDTKFLTSKNAGFERCKKILGKFEEYRQKYLKEYNSDILIKDRISFKNAIESRENRDIKVILSIENGAAISNNLDNIDYFYNKGVRIMSITWNDDNELGTGAKTKKSRGLTNLGFEYVKKLTNLGIIIDVSHLSEKSFYDTISVCRNPVVATHSNVYNLCRNVRNLKDDQIKAIAKCEGIIGICFYSDFLNEKKHANVKDIVEHIKYIRKLVGIDYIGLGSDFDGMDIEKTAYNVDNINKLDNIILELKKQEFKDEEIKKIVWHNWANILKKFL